MEISLDVKSLKIARQPRTAERRMIMIIDILMSVCCFLVIFCEGYLTGYHIAGKKANERIEKILKEKHNDD